MFNIAKYQRSGIAIRGEYKSFGILLFHVVCVLIYICNKHIIFIHMKRILYKYIYIFTDYHSNINHTDDRNAF